MTALEDIKKALEGDMNTGLTAIDRLRFIVGGVPDFDPITVEDADWIISALESLQRENEALRRDRYDLAYAITGGEDAPGLLDTVPTTELVEIARDTHRSHSADIDRAMAAEAEVKRLEAEIDRKSSMPGDHRYWEGRYRDEAAENEKLREALTPFVLAFESRRETYSKRYRSNRQLGYANFDKMPDDWAMEKVAFSMGTYRCAHKALSSAGRDPLKAFDALVEGPALRKSPAQEANTMPSELKPCPFCSGIAERIDIEDGDNAGGSFVHCTVCDASGNIEFEFKENFISNWNRRAEAALSAAEPQPAPSVAVKAIEAVWKYSLVIESSVRRGDGPDQYAGVTEALRLVKEARSALSAQVQDVAGWQDISTLEPKDGMIVMGWGEYRERDGFSPAFMRWYDSVGGWSVGAMPFYPTHWMPLPVAPAKQEG